MSFTTVNIISSVIKIIKPIDISTRIASISMTNVTGTNTVTGPNSLKTGNYTGSYIDTKDDNTLVMYAVDYGTLNRSVDNGLGWAVIASNQYGSAVVAKNDVIYFGNSITYTIRSIDNATTWTTLSNYATQISADSMTISQDGNNNFVASNNGSWILYANNANSIRFTTNMPQNSLVTCGNDDLSVIYVGSSNNNVFKLNFTPADSSLNYVRTTTLPSGNTTKFIRGLACSSDGTIVYASQDATKIYKSIDSGNNFAILTSSPTASTSNIWRSMDCSADGNIIVACMNPGYIYVSASGGKLWTSTNNNADTYLNWNDVTISKDGRTFIACHTTGLYIGNISF